MTSEKREDRSNKFNTLRVLRGLIFPFFIVHFIFLVFYYINKDISLIKFVSKGILELVFSIILFITLGKIINSDGKSKKKMSKTKTILVIWFFIILTFIMAFGGFLFAYLLFQTQGFSIPVVLLCIWGIFYTYLAIYGIVLFIKNYHNFK
ncbi:MAG: hypothetical protein Q7S27_05115 [Nanoarchaeota archaeon]|nr:hypothetical protein [Nanoarchaeota archaeon]